MGELVSFLNTLEIFAGLIFIPSSNIVDPAIPCGGLESRVVRELGAEGLDIFVSFEPHLIFMI